MACMLYTWYVLCEPGYTRTHTHTHTHTLFVVLSLNHYAMCQVDSIPRTSPDTGVLNYAFALYIISYIVVANWTILQVRSKVGGPASTYR